ncbi:YopX family protein [Enterococcus faecalis]|uniref:YopX family protein n=1 Tax=Enterococcus faecalis TaxID=1351 RepID=UPI00192942FD|nr:DNA-packaging protein [Enterococcus faecalis]
MIPKFRAYYAEKMWYVAKIDLWGDPEQTTCDLAPYLPKYDELFDIPLIETALMQSTGLKDENGVDVYQGDIIRCTRGCPHEVIWLEEYGGAFFGGMPAWYLSGLKKGYAWTGEEEVIGNIYENPELLEGTE